MHSRIEYDDSRVKVSNFFLADHQIPIKDFQKLALNLTDITISEDASGDPPVNVFEGGIIRELDSRDRDQDYFASAG